MDYLIHKILAERFTYYKNLSFKGKEKFLARVKKFMDAKDFESRGHIQITDEVKVLISAAAVQLTFGLNSYLIEHFKKIIIYPDKFFSPFSRTTNVGEVNPFGAIVLSWKAFEDGLKSDDDSFNVALHEMAHALYHTYLINLDIDPEFSAYFDKWYVYARKILRTPDAKERKLLRAYAMRDLQELFAVGVENFFERPQKFKEITPELYEHFSNLLNQDPLNKDCKVEFKEQDFSLQPLPDFFIKLRRPKELTVLYVIKTSVLLIVMTVFFLPVFLITFPFVFLALSRIYIVLRRSISIGVFKHWFIVTYPHKWMGGVKKYVVHNIITLDFIDSEKTKYICLITFNKGTIRKEYFHVYSDFESFFDLFQFLYIEKDIAIRRNGEMYIPDKVPQLIKRPFWKRYLRENYQWQSQWQK